MLVVFSWFLCRCLPQIDINLLRTDRGGDPEVVRASEIRRQRDGRIVDEVGIEWALLVIYL